MAEIGRPLDPWQADITRVAFARDSSNLWAAYELSILVARQNGKGGATEAIELGSMYLFREPLIFHSAHQFKTSTAAFRRLQDIISGSDWLMRRTQAISRSKGDESIVLTPKAGGSRLQFIARTDGSGRGLTGSKNIFDEAAWLTVGQFAAQTPGLATIENPQLIYTSTPPDEDVGPIPEDAMLPSVRKRGLRSAPRTALYEWSPPEEYDRDDVDLWYACNPALGIRISEWFLRSQLLAFTEAGKPQKFDTEHLGVWPDDEREQWLVIGKRAWSDLRDPASKLVDPVAFGIDMTPDRSWAAIGAAGLRPDGLEHVEVVEQRQGIGWVVPRMVELDRRWEPCVVVVDESGPASSLIDPLRKAGVEVTALNTADISQAYGQFYDAATDTKTVRHIGQDELDTALGGAAKRDIGDGRQAWGRRSSSVPICSLVAVTNARYGRATSRLHRQRVVVLAGDLMA
jgi:hypothetical protein